MYNDGCNIVCKACTKVGYLFWKMMGMGDVLLGKNDLSVL
jgi:hypothetical protein